MPPPFPEAQRPLLLYLNDGNGGFTIRELRKASYQTTGFTTGDFNGDGRPDIALINASKLQIFLNNGNGGLNDPLESTAPVATVPTAVELSGDNKADLLFTSSSGAQVLINNGGGTFSAPLNITLDSATIISLGDLNGDGLTDLLTFKVGFNVSEVRAYLGDGFGSFKAPLASPVTGGAISGATGDLNGDGKTDLALFQLNNQGDRSIITLLGDGNGRFNSPRSVSFGNVNPLNLFVADFNGDARPDVAVSVSGTGTVLLLPGDGTGGLGAQVTLISNSASQNVMIGQLDSDGITDLITTENNQSGFGNPVFSAYLNRCGASGLAIFGRVLDGASSFGVGGVTVKLSGGQTASTLTDSGGNYQLTGLSASGNYRVIVERGGFEFTPASQDFNNLAVDQVFNPTASRKAVTVSAASYNGQGIAPESIVAVFGVEMTTDTATATTLPLPTQLGSTSALLKDAAGAERPVRLFFVSPNQINLLVPPGVAAGTATLTITQGFSSGGRISTGTLTVAAVAPALFAADSSGQGLAAAAVLRIKADSTQLYGPVAQYDEVQKKFVGVPIDLSNQSDQVFLVAFGTGIRGRSAPAAVTAKIGTTDAEVLFAGANPDFAGLDQINLRLPASLKGGGEIKVVLTVDGKTSNPVRVNIK